MRYIRVNPSPRLLIRRGTNLMRQFVLVDADTGEVLRIIDDDFAANAPVREIAYEIARLSQIKEPSELHESRLWC